MSGLILKDFINLKKNLKIFSVLIIIYGIMALVSQDSSIFSSIFSILFAILTISTYSYDEMAKWDVYALTLPISRDTVVQGKYYMVFILTALGTAASSLFILLINVLMREPSLMSGMGSCLFGAVIILLFYSIAIPIITKLGVEKGRFIFLAVYLVPYLCIYLFSNMVKTIAVSDDVTKMLQLARDNIVVILPIIVVIALAFSYRITIGIYRKKEF